MGERFRTESSQHVPEQSIVKDFAACWKFKHAVQHRQSNKSLVPNRLAAACFSSGYHRTKLFHDERI
ncbi:hypothetical protein NBRC111894_1650 [Sporolactobacillus inulinus]|uniref:Uncharacterized protein n=1 Tax=Sporolactobacillus inulinus TaxID=2078 RepID=A0A4Y1ZAK9_9BACL|nr:hypothetical protein NBRC111894_1650 [Sporolactobacillus inulinus]